MSAVVWELGLNPPILEVDMECGYYLPHLGDTLYDIGDHMNYRALRGFWATTYDQTITAQPQTLPPVPAVIYNNGSVITSGFTLNTTEGMVTFPTADSTRNITADYTAQIPDVVRDATIAQTSWMLAQRTLSQMGLLGVDDMKTGQTMVRRHQMMSGGTKVQAPLCEEALAKLSAYKSIAIG